MADSSFVHRSYYVKKYGEEATNIAVDRSLAHVFAVLDYPSTYMFNVSVLMCIRSTFFLKES